MSARMTATDPPQPMPWLCRIGLHAISYHDTSGTETRPGLWQLRTVPRCNRCHHETGQPTYSLMFAPTIRNDGGEDA